VAGVSWIVKSPSAAMLIWRGLPATLVARALLEVFILATLGGRAFRDLFEDAHAVSWEEALQSCTWRKVQRSRTLPERKNYSNKRALAGRNKIQRGRVNW
jgi:hypothetical protein